MYTVTLSRPFAVTEFDCNTVTVNDYEKNLLLLYYWKLHVFTYGI